MISTQIAISMLTCTSKVIFFERVTVCSISSTKLE